MAVTTSARDLVRHYLEGRPVERSPIVLHIGPYAARLQHLSYQQVAGDPTLLANSLQSAQKLFGCDGLIVLVDDTLEAEACGCGVEWHDDEPVVTSHPLAGTGGPEDVGSLSEAVVLDGIEGKGRLAVALEAAGRLKSVLGKDVSLFPAVTGPVTIARHLRGPSFWTDLDEAPEQADRTLELAGRVMVRVARQYLDAGFEQIVVSDPLLGDLDPRHYPRVAGVLRTLWNVVEFYDARALLQTRAGDDASIEGLQRLGAIGLIVEQGVTANASAGRADERGRDLMFGLPGSLIEAHPEAIEEAVATWRSGACGPRGLVACCTIPRSTPPENVHTVLRLLRA